MDLEKTLTAIPVDAWTTRQAIVLDWHDGPRQGVCSLSHPAAEFVFEQIDERHNPEGMDDRLFRLRHVPEGTVARALEVLGDLGGPDHCVWVPVW